MGPLPDELARLRRGRVLRAAEETRQQHLAVTTRRGYERKAFDFFNYCADMGFASDFRYSQITAFFEWYLTGDDNNRPGANTSLFGFMSAWRSYAEERMLFFPATDSRELRRIRQHVRGAQVRFPHVVSRDLPVTLAILAFVADSLGINSYDDYFTCTIDVIAFMCRLLVAHAACMRTCEHKDGCSVSDVSHPRPGVDGRPLYTIFRVGEEPRSRKIKRRPARQTVLPFGHHRLSAAGVLSVFMRRFRSRADAHDPLFIGSTHGIPSRFAAPWREDLLRLRRIIASAPRDADIPRGNLGRSSLRAGGATDWLAAGASREWVMQQGGWMSDAIDIYNRPSPASRYDMIARTVLGRTARLRRPPRPRRNVTVVQN